MIHRNIHLFEDIQVPTPGSRDCGGVIPLI
jgi:hypothetical protein